MTEHTDYTVVNAQDVTVKPRPRRRWRLILLIAVPVILLLVTAIALIMYKIYAVPSGSMAPTLPAGSRVVVNKLAYRFGPVRHGDIVVFHDEYSSRMLADDGANTPPEERYGLKRVIALPGDTIVIRQDKGVYLNGQLLNEPYAAELPMYDWPPTRRGEAESQPYRIPAGNCFVLGDNRNMSLDSHNCMNPKTNMHYPNLPLSFIVGRVSFTLKLGGK